MTTYIVDCTTRKNDRDETLGPFLTFEKAREEAAEWLGISAEDWKSYTEYESNYDEGTYHGCDQSVEIFERELK